MTKAMHQKSLSTSDWLITFLILLQPGLILYGFYGILENQNIGTAFGVLLIGLPVGLMLRFLFQKLNFNFKSKSGIAFLFSPLIILFSITEIAKKIFGQPSIVLLWLIFFTVYFLLGIFLYIESNCFKPDTKTERKDTIVLMVKVCMIFFILLTFIIQFFGKPFSLSPDSYSYYDMSRNIFTDFGAVGTIRQYVVPTEYGISFPYLFPLIIAIFDKLTGLSIYSGIVINFIASFVSFYFILRVSKLISNSIFPGLIASLALFCLPEYLGEVLAARAIPLSLLCLLIIASRLFKSGGYSRTDLLIIGFFAGAGMVIRFDFLLLSIFVSVAVLILTRKNFKNILFYVLGFFIVIAPWIIYSLVHFQTLWISDNGGTAFYVENYNPLRFFLPDEAIPSLFNQPKQWFESFFNKSKSIFGSVYYILTMFINLAIFIGTLFTLILSKFSSRKQRLNKNTSIILCAVIFYCICKTGLLFLVGFGDARYHIETFLLLQLVILSALYTAFSNTNWWSSFCVAIAVLAFIYTAQPILLTDAKPRLFTSPFVSSQITETNDLTQFKAIVDNDMIKNGKKPENAKVFFLGGDPFRIGCYTGLKSYACNWYVTKERITYLVENIVKPTHIFADLNIPDNKKWFEVLNGIYQLDKIDAQQPLYRVSPKPKQGAQKNV